MEALRVGLAVARTEALHREAPLQEAAHVRRGVAAARGPARVGVDELVRGGIGGLGEGGGPVQPDRAKGGHEGGGACAGGRGVGRLLAVVAAEAEEGGGKVSSKEDAPAEDIEGLRHEGRGAQLRERGEGELRELDLVRPVDGLGDGGDAEGEARDDCVR